MQRCYGGFAALLQKLKGEILHAIPDPEDRKAFLAKLERKRPAR